ncbi:sensor domain-containing diguanylate cyclase [Thiomicrorhabdus arctica]|uniref:sensor domain-containing diguanylate cyclase n=1 Tax=Thiomicrorhabdus arctica TaxID=131540 RepID=UPI000376A609|nr:sensor domain-containing diguanylate cyclase [Thiomicrorhabdus arctica]
MKQALLFITRPLVISLVWISLIIAILYTVTPIPFIEKQTQSIPWSSGQVVIVLFILLWLLSIISPRMNRKLKEALDQQDLEHKEKLKALKQQHQVENSQILALMQNEQFAFWEWNIQTKKAKYSPQWKKMIGLAEDESLTSLNDLQKRIHPRDQESVQQKFLKILSGAQKLFECTHRIQHVDGHYIWVHDKGQVFMSEDGRMEKVLAIRLDVSEQKWIEDELEVDSIIIEHAAEGIAVIDADMQIKRCNQALCRSLKKDRLEIESSDLQTILNGLQTKIDDSILDKVETEGSWQGELNLFDEQNEICLASRISIQKIFHDTTQSTHYSFIHSDITDLKKTQSALDTLANIDSVTGLANRHKLYNILEMALKSKNEVTLMFLDLDNFKNVNDTLGHDIGDLLLKAVGKEISQLIPNNSVLARVGGDEFVFYYEKALSPLSSTEIAQKITDKLKQPFDIKGHQVKIGSSIGIAHYPQQSFDRQSLLKASDLAMYQAKRAGKGQFCEFSEEWIND